MLNDKNNFDTLDILAAAVGVVFAFIVLPQPSVHSTERIVVSLFVLAAVFVKRYCFPTKRANPNSSRGLRMAYLFIALIGTVCAGLALLGLFIDIQELREPEVTKTLLGSGVVLLTVATFIDSRWLKLRE